MVASRAGMPTITARPPPVRARRRPPRSWRAARAPRTRRPRRRAWRVLIARRSSSEPASTVSVAPEARASSSAASVTSTATIGYAPAARRPCTMHWPTPPQPNTTARSPGRTRGRVEDGADAGHGRAADQRGDLEIGALGQLDRLRGRHDDVLGEARRRHEVVEILPARPQARAAVGHAVEVRADLAQRRRARGAGAAAAARRHPRERDRVAHPGRQHARADGLDDARALVAEHHRQVVRPDAVHDVQIGAADARGGDAHAHLAGLRLGELDLLDAQRRAASPTALRPSSACAQHRRKPSAVGCGA